MSNLIERLASMPAEKRFYTVQTLVAHLEEPGRLDEIHRLLALETDEQQNAWRIASPNVILLANPFSNTGGKEGQSLVCGIHPLFWRPEIFGRAHHLCRSNRAEGAKPQRETETEDGSVRPH